MSYMVAVPSFVAISSCDQKLIDVYKVPPALEDSGREKHRFTIASEDE